MLGGSTGSFSEALLVVRELVARCCHGCGIFGCSISETGALLQQLGLQNFGDLGRAAHEEVLLHLFSSTSDPAFLAC